MKGLIGFGIGAVAGTITGAFGLLAVLIAVCLEGDGCWVISESGTNFIENSKLKHSDTVTETE